MVAINVTEDHCRSFGTKLIQSSSGKPRNSLYSFKSMPV